MDRKIRREDKDCRGRKLLRRHTNTLHISVAVHKKSASIEISGLIEMMMRSAQRHDVFVKGPKRIALKKKKMWKKYLYHRNKASIRASYTA